MPEKLLVNSITLRKDLDRKLSHAELDTNFELVKKTAESINNSGVLTITETYTEFALSAIHWTVIKAGEADNIGYTDDIFGDNDAQWLPAAAKMTFDGNKLIIIFQMYDGYTICVQEATPGADSKSWVINWNEDAVIFGDDNDYGVFGFDISNDGSTVLMALKGEDDGQLFIIENNSIVLLTGDVADGEFGRVAKISADGNTIAVGAPGFKTTNNPYFRIYVRDGGAWSNIQSIELMNTVGETLTNPLALSADATIMAIGDSAECVVYIYEMVGGKYTLKTTIEKDYDDHSYNQFGWDISLSDDKHTLAISDRWKDAKYTGAVFIYKMMDNDSSVWNKIQTLNDSSNDNSEGFGAYSRLSDDGSLLIIVEQYYEPGYGDGVPSEIFIYRFNTSTELYSLVVSEKYTDFAFDTINISTDNSTIILGTTTEDNYYPRIYTMAGRSSKLIYKGSEIGRAIDIGSPVISKTIDGGYMLTVASSTSAGERSVAFGYSVDAQGMYAACFGSQNNARADGTMVAGRQNDATADYATAFGYRNDATGKYSTALGNSSIASSYYTLACGYYAKAQHSASVAFGRGTKTGRNYQLVIGMNNVGSADNVFEIGDGVNSSTPHNILEVNADGTMRLNGSNVITEDTLSNAGLLVNKPSTAAIGSTYFVTDLGANGSPIWFNGSIWVDVTGSAV